MQKSIKLVADKLKVVPWNECKRFRKTQHGFQHCFHYYHQYHPIFIDEDENLLLSVGTYPEHWEYQNNRMQFSLFAAYHTHAGNCIWRREDKKYA